VRNALSLAILLVSFVLPASAAIVRNYSQPVNFEYFVPCANAGQGELVHFTGSMQTRLAYVLTDDLLVGYWHIAPALTALGETTGVSYKVLGSNQYTFKVPQPYIEKGIQTGTFINNFSVVGDGVVYHIHEKFRYLFTFENSTLEHDDFFAFCK
jgi:hypothetical protein